MEADKEVPTLDRTRSLRILALGFGLSFIHLFWYGSPWTAWLAFFCYAPFLYWLREYSKRPFVAGLTFGYFYALMNTYWLAQFVGRWTNSLLVSIFVIIVVGTVWGTFYGLACVLRARIGFLQSSLAFAILLTVTELARMNIPELEFPFCPIGEPLIAYSVLAKSLQTASYAMFLVLAVNSFLTIVRFDFIRSLRADFARLRRPLIIFACCFAAAVLLANLGTPKSEQKLGLRVALGQLGTDLAYGDQHTEASRVREAVDDLSQQAMAQQADLLILPEGIASFRTTPETPFSLYPNLEVLFGTQHGTGPRYQGAYLWDGHGFRYTDKKRLVVFGEYVPFRGIIPYPAGFQLPTGDLAAGSERHTLEVKKGITVGPLICFEALFPGSAKEFQNLDASFLAVMSLDDWYIGTNAIPRLVIAARWRAVETGKWITRVGSLGRTMVIDPHGQIRAQIPEGERKLLIYDL
ncbi:MAG: apolipoprotein N-acyltransferase [Armatimonadetes bacterium]|nr:apolipoprotein N-acyltransferase [Armatimonadota bacterium]